MSEYIDLSLPFDGKFRFKIECKKEMTYEKDAAQVTSYTISAHSFTHLDAPIHMAGLDRKTITDYPVGYFIGEASLIDLPRGKEEPITGKDLEVAGKHCRDGDIVFIRTGWLEKMWGKGEFVYSPYLTNDAAEWLVSLKARIAGYDFMEDRPPEKTPASPYAIHRILLRNEVLNLEYVNNLSQIKVPRFHVFAMPIRLQGFDGAPCRPVAVV